MKKKIILRDTYSVGEELYNTKMNKGGTLYLKIKREDGTQFMQRLEHNETMVGGSQLVQAKMFRLNDGDVPSTIKEMDASVDATLGVETWSTGTNADTKLNDRRIFGFALGTDGASDTAIRKIYRRSKGWENGYVMPLLGFATNDNGENYFVTEDGSERQEYTMRRLRDGEYLYFAKLLTFEHSNSLIGGENIADPDSLVGSETDIETISETEFDITGNDLVYHFKEVVNNLPARFFNSIKILSGRLVYTTAPNGKTVQEFADVIVTNVININSQTLGIKDEVTLVYRMEF